jgi:transmembrane sensor
MSAPQSSSTDEQVREEAAIWCLRMNSEDADRYRATFEAWLSRSGAHRRVYSEVSELFSYAGTLRNLERREVRQLSPPDRTRAGKNLPSHRRRWLLPTVAMLMMGAMVGLYILWPAAEPGTLRLAAADANAPVLRTGKGVIRTFTLADGSRVTLDTHSIVSIQFDQTVRRLTLEQGRARFEVAHEVRPFVVAAGRGSVRALGTIFDVSLASDNSMNVVLLRGAIDVRRIASHPGKDALEARKLSAGQAVGVASNGRLSPTHETIGDRNESWPSGLATFAGTPLRTVLQEANRYAHREISLADPRLGERQVYGTLRIDDPARLAPLLAGSLGLRVEVRQDRILLSSE